jgi:hypothetical protein
MIFCNEPVLGNNFGAGDWDYGAKGLIPRDYSVTPMRAVVMPLIPRSEWSGRIKQKIEEKSQLSDIRGGIPSLNQGEYGYCWAHSSTHAHMLLRAIAGVPYVPLSAFAVAATIKNGRNEGAWGALSLDFISEKGQPSQATWPQGNASPRLGTPECWQEASNYKVTEAWNDVALPAYDRDLSFDQVATCLLSSIPVVGDFNWWGHSVCLLDLVETSPGQFGVRIWNSWGDEWGEKGMGVLSGSKAIPDGACAPRASTVRGTA